VKKPPPPRYDEDKVEEAVLALLGALEFENGRAWKRFDFAIMDALHQKGLISNPRGHVESVILTEEGLRRGKALAERMFSADRAGAASSVDKGAPKP
jgi:Domain of unknown function (DUF6429)